VAIKTEFAKGLQRFCRISALKSSKRSDQVSGFVVLPKRWIVERTIGMAQSLPKARQDWENLNRKALSVLRLASIRLMLRKTCNRPESPTDF